ncbi:L-serine ammonia-lyase [Mucor mucedo]|uniref:L-serine ammonia-lyase n=1 Tax=Mucor mucedo TaxID=29922 RepID=UPI00221F6DDD|nr:L-serine ammonia-lyase [Mucor mucedo]KAI7887703.1 L-serine ammonia-lyase [Mucor mucedo]
MPDTNQASLFNLFSIGTCMSPMRASKVFIHHLKQHDILQKVHTLRVDMFGSLTKDTREAILMGVATDQVCMKEISTHHSICLDGTHRIHFNPDKHLVFHHFKTSHPQGLRYCAFDSEAGMIATNEFFAHTELLSAPPFKSMSHLVQTCKRENKTIAQLVYDHELKLSTPKQIQEKLLRIWKTMDASIKNGIMAQGVLPGGHLRRASFLYNDLLENGPKIPKRSPLGLYHHSLGTSSFLQSKSFLLHHLEYLSVYQLALKEENACGGSVVAFPETATTIIPSVLKYYIDFISDSPEKDIMDYLFTIAALGSLQYRTADQGLSMAAAGFTAVMGGTLDQVEKATQLSLDRIRFPHDNDNVSAVKAIAVSQLALGASSQTYPY